MARIVIIDDEKQMLEMLGRVCRGMGHSVETSLNARDGMRAMEQERADLLILDLRIGDGSGLDVIRECRERFPDTGVVMVTGFGCVASAVEAMKLGSYDYLTKPFSVEDFSETVRRALQLTAGARPVSAQAEMTNGGAPAPIIGSSPPMEKITRLISRIAGTRSPVLLEGEFGTGKRTVARAIHHAGARRSHPMRVLPCSSLSESALEQELFGTGDHTIFQRAGEGTVIIEEIHLLSQRLQSRLEAWMEGWSSGGSSGAPAAGMRCRLIATSGLPLEDLVRSGRFREDLYYRLSLIPITVPPLRNRREDILPLAAHFLRRSAQSTGNPVKEIDPAAVRILTGYAWPGNISELRNAMERADSFADEAVILPGDLPPKLTHRQEAAPDARDSAPLPIGSRLSDFVRKQERMFIRETMKHNAGSREKTASMLGVSMATLYRKIGLRIDRNRISG